jgi:hypothetical protein
MPTTCRRCQWLTDDEDERYCVGCREDRESEFDFRALNPVRASGESSANREKGPTQENSSQSLKLRPHGRS